MIVWAYERTFVSIFQLCTALPDRWAIKLRHGGRIDRIVTFESGNRREIGGFPHVCARGIHSFLPTIPSMEFIFPQEI